MKNQGFKIVYFVNGQILCEDFFMGLKESERDKVNEWKEAKLEQLAELGMDAFGFIYYVPNCSEKEGECHEKFDA